MSLQEIMLLSMTEIIGDYGLKEFANKGGIIPLSVGIGGYIGVIWMLIVSLQGSTILMVNGAWDGMSAIVESLFAYAVLGERFHHSLQYVGLFFIIVGVYLLKIPKTDKPFVFPRII